MTKRSEQFGRLLKAGISSTAYIEGKTAPVVEDELGQQIGVAGYTIQRYKAGHLPVEARTVQILATACVQRGLLGRPWLERFLHAAHFPAAEILLNQLCPVPQAQPALPRVYENLPAPIYTQFVPREQAMAEIADGLQQRSPVVLLTGFGGSGKTSLAREVATRCLRTDTLLPSFEAAVWVSDKDRPGSTNLSVVLDEVVRTLDFPGFIQYGHEEKRRAVEQLLKRQRVLLIIDNFETITDATLLAWLISLPEPSKALVTSREQQRGLDNYWLVELGGMSETEAHTLIAQRLRALRLDRLVSDRNAFTPLITLTDGNPKALELALGLIKHEHRTVQQLADDLRSARGALFDDLFARAWALLDRTAQHIVMTLTFFPTSANAEALAAIVQSTDTAFDRSTERLADLALIDVQQGDITSPPRYTLHPLVRVFVAVQLHGQRGLEEDARERWLRWCLQWAEQVGFCWNNLERLSLLDLEHDTVQAAIDWAFAQQRNAEAIRLIEGIRYYYNVRGLWDERLNINLMRIAAARKIGDVNNEVLALAHHAEIRSKQDSLEEAAALLVQLQDAASGQKLEEPVEFEIHHAAALHHRALGELGVAEQCWRDLLPLTARLGGQPYVINRRWLATCLMQQGRLNEARQLFQESIEDARAINDERSVTGNLLKLAAIELGQGNLAAAQTMLSECLAIAERYQDRRRLGELLRLRADLYVQQGNVSEACVTLVEASDLFERMGMRREQAEAHDALTRLGSNEVEAVP